MDIWNILEIEQTTEIRKIKKAYAALIKRYNPEEHMQKFLQIRDAYTKAIKFAAAPNDKEEPPAQAINQVLQPLQEDVQDLKQGLNWDFVFDMDDLTAQYENCEGFKQFIDLYFNKKCNDKNVWLNYFASADFLKVYRERGFTRLLYRELVENNEHRIKIKAFFSLLPIVYCLSYTPKRDVLGHGSADRLKSFEGIDDIDRIVEKYRCSLKINNNNDIAILCGYQDYIALLTLTELGMWDNEIAYCVSNILSRYVSAYIHDNVPQNGTVLYEHDFLPRHISSLKLITYFFESIPLPKQAFEIAWYKLDLKNAKMGKNKVLYGRLKEITLKKYPEFEYAEKENFNDMRKEHKDLNIFIRNKAKAEIKERVDAFFRCEDLKSALCNQAFVEKDILSYWITENSHGYYLEKFLDYCADTDNQVLHRGRIISKIDTALYAQNIRKAFAEDEEAEICKQCINVNDRAFFRYLINISFNALSNLLNTFIPYSYKWAENFLEYDSEKNCFNAPKRVTVALGESSLDIVFNLYYAEYLIDGKPVYNQFIEFDSIKCKADDNLFWVLLPLAFSHSNHYNAVYEEIMKRVGALSFIPKQAADTFGNKLADIICAEYEGEFYPEALIINKESWASLYTCKIDTKDFYYEIYKIEKDGRQVILEGNSACHLHDAIEAAKRQLALYADPLIIEKLVIAMPDELSTAYSNSLDSAVLSGHKTYAAEEVTQDFIREQLLIYQDSKQPMKSYRIEFRWKSRALVLVKNQNKYACFCFDDNLARTYTLLAHPEIYQNTDSSEIKHVDFLLGKLPEYNAHNSPMYILSKIKWITEKVSDSSYDLKNLHEWSMEVYLHNKHQYEMDKVMLGGQRFIVDNRNLYQKFYLTDYPSQVRIVKLDGACETIEVTAHKRFEVSEKLTSFMHLRLSKLILNYPGGAYNECLNLGRHIVLLNENSQFAMLFFDDISESVQCLIADVHEYCSDKPKHKTALFWECEFYQYMIHSDIRRIREYLNLLLLSMKNPNSILHIFGQFGYLPKSKKENNAEQYQTIRQKLLD